jgi:hypothetical protein
MSTKYALFLVVLFVSIVAYLWIYPSSNEYDTLEIRPVHLPDHSRPDNPSPEDNAHNAELADEQLASDSQVSGRTVRIRDAYDVAFGEQQHDDSLSELHHRFKNEPRDEAWATAMESGISQHIATSGSVDWATVEHIECRTRICEVLGLMPDAMENPEMDPYALLPDGFEVGWWQGGLEILQRDHTYDGEGITRFMLIIVRIDEDIRDPQ